MKKMLLVLMILAFAATTAMAYTSSIGMYADDLATICDLDLPVYVSTPVYFFAHLDPAELSEISAVQFKVDNIPSAGESLVTPDWNTDLAIGDLAEDLSLAFNPYLDGPLAFLGIVNFFALGAFDDDYVLTILPGDTRTDIILVNGPEGEIPVEIIAGGSQFTFNCTEDCGCGTATDETTWSSIKALY